LEGEKGERFSLGKGRAQEIHFWLKTIREREKEVVKGGMESRGRNLRKENEYRKKKKGRKKMRSN